jgi:hypothetical protein
MADISIPQYQQYFRVAVRNPKAYTGTMYHNHVNREELERLLEQIRTNTPEQEIVSVEHIIIDVTVVDVTGVYTQD